MELATEYQLFKFGLLHLEWTTSLYVLVVFLITLFFLNRLFLTPIVRTLKNREIEIKRFREQVIQDRDKRERLQEEYNEKERKFLNKIRQDRTEILDGAKHEAEALIQEIKIKNNSILEKAEVELEKEIESIKANSQAVVETIAELVQESAFDKSA